jgi:hypothetical protein
VRALSPILCLTLCTLALTPAAVLSSAPPELRTHDETVGQEYQREGHAAVHPDGSWTAGWVDYRTGYPSIYLRSFDSQDTPLGPGIPITDGYGLYAFDVNAEKVAEPFLVSIGDGTSVIAWTEKRHFYSHVRAAIVGPDGLVVGPVTVDTENRLTTKRAPCIAISGDRILVVWTEGDAPSRQAYGQIYAMSLVPLFGNFQLDANADDVQSDPRAVASSVGWVVAWYGETSDPSQVLVRPFDRDGLPLSATKSVEAAPEVIQSEPAIAAVPGGYFLTWTNGVEGRVSLAGRLLDTDLNSAAPSFLISTDEETVTPRAPELLALDATSLLVVWTAGSAQISRFHARRVVLPSTASGSIVIVDDPTAPPGQSIVPRSLALVRGSSTPARVIWSDARDGWELVFHLPADADGQAIGIPLPIEEDEGTATQAVPDVTILPDYRGAVIWEDFRSGNLGVYGAFLDSEGRPEGGSFRISEMSGGAASAPADNFRDLLRNRPVVGATKNGSVVAAWTTFLSAGSRVMVQIYDPTGTAVGGNTLLEPACGAGIQGQPAFAATQDGGFYLVWWDTCYGGAGDVYARHFRVDGVADGDTIRVPDRAYQGAGQIHPVVSSGEGGETVIAWLDDRMGNYDVYAQRLGPTGQKIGQNVPISTPEDGGNVIQTNPDVASQADRYVVVWDEEPFAGGGVTGLLTVLPSAKSGADESRLFNIVTGSPGLKYPRVAMAPDGRFVVTYWDTANDSVRVMAQRYDAHAVPLGVPYCVTSLGGTIATLQGGVAADIGRIRYAFADNRDRRGWDVRVRTVGWTFNGGLTPVAVTAWTIVDDEDSLLLRWSVPQDHAGTLYRVWREEGDVIPGADRPGSGALLVADEPVGPLVPGQADYEFRDRSADRGSVYLYWIEDGEGEFAGPWAGSRSGPKLALDLRAIDNPFREWVRLAWSLPRAGQSELAIYDLSGRLVRTLLPSRRRASGGGDAVWDGRDETGRDLPSGVYWARLRLDPSGERSVKLLRLR